MTGGLDTAEAQRVVDAYIQAWNDPEKDARQAILAEIWADAGRYADPRDDVTGRAALVELIESRRATRPGAWLERTGIVDTHHDMARFAWCLVAADGSHQLEAVDFVQFDAQGRLLLVVGFFGTSDGIQPERPGTPLQR